MHDSDYQVAVDAIGTAAVDALVDEYRPLTPRANGGRTSCLSIPITSNIGRKRGDSTIGARIVRTIGADKARHLAQALGGETIWLSSSRSKH
ncbi:hypothetical protein EDC56_1269 [Sinobacterium caligoides]|uniref:Uncharacterized protein n=1 Tax=Sinobacterium caligoides TaxID=933926 RepID=A0A3N2E206_9GAMM|nr:hypothetical protein EDC56_1269 [Sinobacterium caligoides]